MTRYIELINKSVGAAILIGLGDYALLKLGNPLGPVLFTLGLLGVCYMGQNLFTGKCGFLIEDKIKGLDLFLILIVNLIAGYILGLLFSITDKEVLTNAVARVATWDFTFAYFIKAVMCGVIMYIAVLMYRKGTPLGIIFGIPLFIFCGFQHSIANIITLGAGQTIHIAIILAIIGNFVGSLLMWYFSKDIPEKKIRKRRKKML
ncbi:MAG: formate/nitrite transporter family protein [Bacilli bacterium]|nr:formate/nitrite transporter family protein [Bacilli bacterium]